MNCLESNTQNLFLQHSDQCVKIKKKICISEGGYKIRQTSTSFSSARLCAWLEHRSKSSADNVLIYNMGYISDGTGFDKKTVAKLLNELQDAGFLAFETSKTHTKICVNGKKLSTLRYTRVPKISHDSCLDHSILFLMSRYYNKKYTKKIQSFAKKNDQTSLLAATRQNTFFSLLTLNQLSTQFMVSKKTVIRSIQRLITAGTLKQKVYRCTRTGTHLYYSLGDNELRLDSHYRTENLQPNKRISSASKKFATQIHQEITAFAEKCKVAFGYKSPVHKTDLTEGILSALRTESTLSTFSSTKSEKKGQAPSSKTTSFLKFLQAKACLDKPPAGSVPEEATKEHLCAALAATFMHRSKAAGLFWYHRCRRVVPCFKDFWKMYKEAKRGHSSLSALAPTDSRLRHAMIGLLIGMNEGLIRSRFFATSL